MDLDYLGRQHAALAVLWTEHRHLPLLPARVIPRSLCERLVRPSPHLGARGWSAGRDRVHHGGLLRLPGDGQERCWLCRSIWVGFFPFLSFSFFFHPNQRKENSYTDKTESSSRWANWVPATTSASVPPKAAQPRSAVNTMASQQQQARLEPL